MRVESPTNRPIATRQRVASGLLLEAPSHPFNAAPVVVKVCVPCVVSPVF